MEESVGDNGGWKIISQETATAKQMWGYARVMPASEWGGRDDSERFWGEICWNTVTDWILMGRKGRVNCVLRFPSRRQGEKRCWCQMKHLGKLGLWGGCCWIWGVQWRWWESIEDFEPRERGKSRGVSHLHYDQEVTRKPWGRITFSEQRQWRNRRWGIGVWASEEFQEKPKAEGEFGKEVRVGGQASVSSEFVEVVHIGAFIKSKWVWPKDMSINLLDSVLKKQYA